MIRALLRRNLRHQRGLLAGIVVGVVAWSMLLVYIGAEFASGSQLEEMLALMPPIIRELVGSQIGAASFPSFVAFTFQHPAMLGVSLAFIIVAATAPAGDRDAGLLDLLLARPLPRRVYLTSVVLTILIDAVVATLSIMAGIIIGLGIIDVPDEPSWTRYIASATSFLLINLAVAGTALLAAVCAPRRGTAVAWMVALVFGLYVVELLADLWSPLAAIRWISPFHYFKPVDAALAGTWSAPDIVVLSAVFTLSSAAAFIRFERREI